MAEKQVSNLVAIPSDTAPPPHTTGNEDYQQNDLGYAVNPGYQNQPGSPTQAQQPGYPPQDKAGYPTQSQPGYGYPTGYAQQPMPAAMMATHNTTVVQAGGPTVIAAVYPPDHCFLSWFTCLCGFWPIGICAIINSSNARDAINRGDLASASIYSQMAEKYANWSFGCGVMLIIGGMILRAIVYSAS